MSRSSPAPDDWQRMQAIEKVALALRFLLEIAAVLALAWWGIRTGGDDVSRTLLAVVAAGGLIIVWGLLVAPKARNPLSPMTRWLLGTVLLMLAAVALWTAGAPDFALVFAALVAIDTAIILWLDYGRRMGPG